ncbi:MAG: hypothetical protein JXR95_07255 [Deltaproteobacteria bacterium]|nr:hypothetical protein [Deltaproteobacteria bacterium]
MKKILVVSTLAVLFTAFPASGQDKKAASQGPNVIEVQIPKPKFEIYRAWEYGGFWKWDEKDPRFFKEFLNKIHESLFLGPF